MPTTTNPRSKGFPWGLAALAIGGYLLFKHQEVAAATSAAATQTRAAVQDWAAHQGQPTVVDWANTAPDEDIARMAAVIPKFAQYGYCPDDGQGNSCLQNWRYLKDKYPTVFAYSTYY